MPPKVLCILGTRPEVIKMASVIKALRARDIETKVLATAQHRHLLDQMLEVFNLEADWDLNVMRLNQSLSDLTGALIPKISEILTSASPSAVLAQGDTTTAMCAALAAYYQGIPFGHVEAGLRSGDLRSPFPEEANRRLISVLARWHFAPTARARFSLQQEGGSDDSIHVVGNSVIDALLDIASRNHLPWPSSLPPISDGERLVLLTLHRRESFGPSVLQTLGSIREFARCHPDARIAYPVHPNPNVRNPAVEYLGGLPNVSLLDPMDYPTLVNLMKQAYVVFTDSGGIQEEAPALGKPVFVFRDVTERPEAVEAGAAILVGRDASGFHSAIENLWNNPTAYRAMATPRFPFGNGDTGEQIAEILAAQLT